MKKITCIIPAYNEGNRIQNVINTAKNNSFISEIIVINDGSTDNTYEVISKIKNIELINLKKNKGKTNAIIKGFEKAKGDYILLLDADLIGLNNDNINNLIMPIINNEAEACISLRKNSLYIFKLFNLDFISGERIFKKDLLGENDIKKLNNIAPFGLEVYINNKLIENKTVIKSIYWDNTISPRKSVKYGLFKGIIGDIKMSLEIIKTIGLIGIIKQFKSMIKLIRNK